MKSIRSKIERQITRLYHECGGELEWRGPGCDTKMFYPNITLHEHRCLQCQTTEYIAGKYPRKEDVEVVIDEVEDDSTMRRSV